MSKQGGGPAGEAPAVAPEVREQITEAALAAAAALAVEPEPAQMAAAIAHAAADYEPPLPVHERDPEDLVSLTRHAFEAAGIDLPPEVLVRLQQPIGADAAGQPAAPTAAEIERRIRAEQMVRAELSMPSAKAKAMADRLASDPKMVYPGIDRDYQFVINGLRIDIPRGYTGPLPVTIIEHIIESKDHTAWTNVQITKAANKQVPDQTRAMTSESLVASGLKHFRIYT